LVVLVGGSALECAACLDTLVARRRIDANEAAEAKALLERIVSMLWRTNPLANRDRSFSSGAEPAEVAQTAPSADTR
jgi:hypothetical protein